MYGSIRATPEGQARGGRSLVGAQHVELDRREPTDRIQDFAFSTYVGIEGGIAHHCRYVAGSKCQPRGEQETPVGERAGRHRECALHPEAAPESTLSVQHGHPAQAEVVDEDRVTHEYRGTHALELSGPFSLAPHGLQEPAITIVVAQLARAPVRNYYATVVQQRGSTNLEQLVHVLAFQHANIHCRLGRQPPALILGPGAPHVLDDRDSGAVTLGDRRTSALATGAGDEGQRGGRHE